MRYVWRVQIKNEYKMLMPGHPFEHVTALCPECRKRNTVHYDEFTGWWMPCTGCHKEWDVPAGEIEAARLQK